MKKTTISSVTSSKQINRNTIQRQTTIKVNNNKVGTVKETIKFK